MIQLLLILAGWYTARLIIVETVYYTSSPSARAFFILAMIAFDMILVGLAYYFNFWIADYMLYFAGAKAVTICFVDYNHLLYLNLNES